jgi:hypothetical protein
MPETAIIAKPGPLGRTVVAALDCLAVLSEI